MACNAYDLRRTRAARKAWKDFLDGKHHLVPVWLELARKAWR